MKKINKDNRIFSSEEFQKDRYKFYIILKNLDSPELELYSDEENYIICRGSKKWPTWIWTKDNFDKDKINEIEELMKLYLIGNEKDKFTCKKELYDLLLNRNFEYLNKEDYFEMGFLICHKTKKPKLCDGTISIPTEEDLPVLQKYFYDDHNEMNGVDTITLDEAKIKAQEYLDSGMFYVLRNKDNKIVSMAGYNVVEDQAKINAVYTPKEERRKGYAANLVYLMTNDLLNKNLVPLLYTDYNYIPSNKAYVNAGYEDKGILINFSCSMGTKISRKN